MATIAEGLALAMQYHQARNFPQAERLYRQILQADPANANALHLLGVLAYQMGQHLPALDYIRQAVALGPSEASFHGNLGLVYQALRQSNEAVSCYQRALQLRPDYPEAHNNLGSALKDLRRLDEAIASFQQALHLRPDFPEAHNNLGNALREKERLDEASACYRQALRLRPNFPEAHNNLGNILQQQGRREEAIGCYQQALLFRPGYAEAHSNMGNVLRHLGQLEEAIRSYRQALLLRPDWPEALHNLAMSLHQQGQWDEAIGCYQQALRLQPDSPEVHNNLGNVLKLRGRLEEAIRSYSQALRLRPNFADAHYNLGIVLFKQGQLPAAVSCYRRTLQLKPDHAEAHLSLGYALQLQGQLTEAISCHQRVLQLRPDLAEAYLNLGLTLASQGEQDEGVGYLWRALQLKPGSPGILNSYLNTLQYSPGVSLAQLHSEHLEFEKRHAAPRRTAWRPHANVRDPDRPLRLGFISPHFSQHPVGYFLIGALENLDRLQGEVVCYSDTVERDGMNARFQAAATHWHDVADRSDEELVQQIRADRIDILFDLAGHTGGNRLLAFARKPAPIQITWLDYVGTTGLRAMDYILADPQEIPPEAEPWYVEKVLRMPNDYVCYEPPANAPPIGPLPALANGTVTFGSFNLLNKITTLAVDTWARILHRLPRSTLLIKYLGLNDAGTAGRFHKLFADRGIDPDRVLLEGPSPHAQVFTHYQRLDIALDPFPYNGGLTTCEALWMSVPVITCPGETFAGRHALTHLTNVGLTETIARNPDHYVELAVDLAQDLPRLAALRARLRQQMAASPLCDGRRFAENLMALLRQVWRQWIAS